MCRTNAMPVAVNIKVSDALVAWLGIVAFAFVSTWIKLNERVWTEQALAHWAFLLFWRQLWEPLFVRQ